MTNLEKIEALENTGMIDMMIHQKNRFFGLYHLNNFAHWQKWIRS